MSQVVNAQSSWLSTLYLKGRWLLCVLPPAAFITTEETPGLSGLDGINVAALIVLSPIFLVMGFALTAAIVAVTRWIGSRVRLRSRGGLASLMLVIVGILSPLEYLDGDWLLLGVIELASLPAALILTAGQTPKGEKS
jgi:hypothetical protein